MHPQTPTLRRALAALLATLALCTAHAGTGLMQFAAHGDDGPVTVFYPTQAADAPVQRGAFVLQLAPDAPPLRGNGRLVVVSHGSGGAPWVHTDLARALVADGFIVALPEHKGDNWHDMRDAGPDSWKRRPAEVSRAIDALQAHAIFGPLLDTGRVGMFGGSAGGHTALTLAGGRWSPAGLLRHCEAHIAEDFSSCAGYITRLHGNVLDGFKMAVARTVIRWRFDDATPQSHTDARIAAVIAAVPYAADFDMASLAQPRVPLGLVVAGRDINQVPRFHVEAVRRACSTCTMVAEFAQGSHGVMLSPMPPMERLPTTVAALLADPSAFDRAPAIRALNAATVAFFRQHLLP